MATPSTSQGNEMNVQWHFSSSLNINSQTDNPASCVQFDTHEEIVWVGSTTGKVTSFLPQNPCNRYTAFVASKVSPVHSLMPTEPAIFSLTDTVLRVNTRQGIPVGKFSSPSMTQMRSMYHIPLTTTFILGGRQQKLIHYDFVKEKEIRTAELSEDSAMIIRYNGTNTITADESGNVHIKNPKNCETIHSLHVFNDRVVDFDVAGNKMVACGISNSPVTYSNRHNHPDTFVKVYDLRTYRALPPLGVNIPPRFVRFMPSYCDRLCIAYQVPNSHGPPNPWNRMGGIKMLDLDSKANAISITLEGPMFTDMTFSSNRQYLGLANECGIVSLFCDREDPLINDHSKETTFAAPPVQPPVSFAIDDNTQTLGSIPLAFVNEPYLSDWPSQFTEIRHRRMKPPGNHQHAKNIHYALQIENPRANTKLKKHNIVPYILEDPAIEKGAEISMTPPQNSKKERFRVSKLYRRPPMPPQKNHRITKKPDETMETYTWNVLRHLTFQSQNNLQMLVNNVAHVIFSLSPLRDVVLRHLCLDVSCITCELHFLFIAFASKVSSPINTTNLSWALLRHNVTMQNGMFPAVHHVIQAMLLDVCEKSQRPSSVMPAMSPEPPVELPMTSQLEKHYKCTMCGAMQPAVEDEHSMWTFEYDAMIRRATLCQMLDQAVHFEEGTIEMGEKKCVDCQKTSRMEVKRKVKSLSPLLLIDTNTAANNFFHFWREQIAIFEQRPAQFQPSVPASPAETKPCRYGAACKRLGVCKYKHGLVDWQEEQTKLLENVESPGWSHYIPSRIAVMPMHDGTVKFSDISESPDYDEPNAIIYELDAMIDFIGNGDGWTHPVTLLRESPVTSTEWTLVNEQLVSRLHSHEARSINVKWKVPSLLAYKRKGYEVKTQLQKIPEEMFFAGENLAVNGEESKAIRCVEELPGQGELVGLDCEFIKVQFPSNLFDLNKSTQSKAIGRASMVNSTGEKVIFDDHVILGEGAVPIDYLTMYSGIVAEDLNPMLSTKFLTSHKRVLLRMLVLQQRGVVFVGHALQNDFGVMNIHIPDTSVIDTVEIWKKETDRMLSLQFLARMTLGESIQEAAHDSVIDAQYALKIYHRYLEIKEKNQMAEILPSLYSYLPSESPSHHHSGSPLVVYTNQMKTIEDAEAPPST